MQIEIRNDSVRITGYVNAVERLSKPITEVLRGKMRTFLERIKAGVFKKALKRNDNVLVLLNHDKNRVLASQKDNTAKLIEDNIGLQADVTIYDEEVIRKAREGKLTGWSFGFHPNSDELTKEGNSEVRTVTDLDLVEVSILDDTKEPAYSGTSIESRSNKSITYRDLLIEDEENNEEKEESEKEEKDTDIDEEKLEKFAEKIAEKVIEKININLNKEKNPEETYNQDENRNIDYSDYEERIKKISKKLKK